MKLLSFTDLNTCSDPYLKLQPVINEYAIDIIIALGGIFRTLTDSSSQLSSKIKRDNNKKFMFRAKEEKVRNFVSDATFPLEQLSLFQKPIIVIPSKVDLSQNALIKRASNSENILYRWLDNKATPIEGWLYYGLSLGEQFIDSLKYAMLAPQTGVWCVTDQLSKDLEKSISSFDLKVLPRVILVPKQYYSSDLSLRSLIFPISSIIENEVSIIDLEDFTVSSVSIF